MRSAEIARQVAGELDSKVETSEMVIQIMKMIAELEDVPLSRAQRFGAAAIGGSMSVYDQQFDKYDIRTAEQKAVEVARVVAEGTDVDTADVLHPNLKRGLDIVHANLRPETVQQLGALTEAQVTSLKQRTGELDVNGIEEITRSKGAHTALLFATEVNPDMSLERKKCYEELGYLIQLLDDLKDKDEDAKEGIDTLATLSVQPSDMLKRIKAQGDTVKQAFQKAYSHKDTTTVQQYIDRLLATAGIAIL